MCSNPTPPSTKPADRISRVAFARQFEEDKLGMAACEVVVIANDVAVFVAATASGACASRLTACTTKTSLSNGLSCRSTEISVKVFATRR